MPSVHRQYTVEKVDDYPKKVWYRLCFAVLIWFIVIFSILIYILFTVIPELQSTIVRTKNGPIRGEYVRRLDKKVYVFKGIPYAKPPLGHLRFKRPQPVDSWRGLLYSDDSKAACYQHKISFFEKVSNILLDKEGFKQSEDCLYLNIFSPNIRANVSELKPVVVWIHGGGFVFGRANSVDGSILSAFGDIVVVTVAFRLGIFGFLNADDDLLPGNAGLYDQRLALEWIDHNIQFFGGDRRAITLFGEFSGATSIGYHMISPKSNRLFKRAILHSGGPMMPVMMFEDRNNIKTFDAVIEQTECRRLKLCGNSSPDEILQTKIDCLRKVNAEKLVEIQHKLGKSRLGFYPVIDGSFFVKHPYESVEKQEFGPQTDVLIGLEQVDELPSGLGPIERIPILKNLTGNITGQQVVQKMHELNPAYSSAKYQMLVDMIMREDKAMSAVNFTKRLANTYNNFVFRCPDYNFVRHFTRNGTRKVFYFELERKINTLADAVGRLKSFDSVFFAGHTHYAFGYPLLNIDKLDHREMEFTFQIMRQTTNFIKFGNPSVLNWEACENGTLSYLLINKDSSVIIKNAFPVTGCEENFSHWYEMGKNYYSLERNRTIGYKLQQ